MVGLHRKELTRTDSLLENFLSVLFLFNSALIRIILGFISTLLILLFFPGPLATMGFLLRSYALNYGKVNFKKV